MRVAVVGAGLFGCTSALFAAKAGHEVHIYEKADHILAGATSANQFRMHQGYHYPRAPETVRECKKGIKSFSNFYAGTMTGTNPRYYAIANEGSHLNAGKYLTFLDSVGLPWKVADPDVLDNIQIAVRVNEVSLDPFRLYEDINIKISLYGIHTHFNEAASEKLRREYDQIIVAAYSNTNEVLESLGVAPEEYQYEVVEKPVIQMPTTFGNTSAVIMDGPFCSVDPFPGAGGHLMGHVEHAIWKRSFGARPEIPQELEKYINKGIISSPENTKWPMLQADGSRYIPPLELAKHVGSFFTVRAVLRGMEDTDARPTLVKRLDDNVIRIFSGKMPTACEAAARAVDLLG